MRWTAKNSPHNIPRLSACLRAWLAQDVDRFGLASFTCLLKMSGTLTGLRSYCEPAMVDAGALAAGIVRCSKDFGVQAYEVVARQTQNNFRIQG